MATRSLIGLEKDNNMVEYIYCHEDGYPEHVGSILKNHYNSKQQIEELLKLGFLRNLEATIKESKFYVRDSGESYDENKSCKEDKQVYLSYNDKEMSLCGSEYRYLYTKDSKLLCYKVYDKKFVIIP